MQCCRTDLEKLGDWNVCAGYVGWYAALQRRQTRHKLKVNVQFVITLNRQKYLLSNFQVLRIEFISHTK